MLWRASTTVLRDVRLLALALTVTLVTLLGVLLLPHTTLIVTFWQSSTTSLAETLAFIASLLSFTHGNFSIFSALYTLAIAVLLGLNVAFLVYFIKRSQTGSQPGATSWLQIGGVVSGVFGMGCAACGIAVLAAVLQLIGATWLIVLLPLHGAEFGMLAVLLLTLSLWQLSKKITDPLVCPVV